jgi:hypothetical protein
MQHRRRVFIETPKGRISARFSVPVTADAADVSVRLREKGWAPYRLRLDREQDCWIATVINWRHAA